MAKKKKKKTGVLGDKELLKKYPGSGTVTTISIKPEHDLWLPSKSIVLNYLLGGGIPWGKIMEIYGTESSGKTIIALDFAEVCQNLGGWVIWNDAEQAFTKSWALAHGLDPDRIIIWNATSVEYVSDWFADNAIALRNRLVNNEPILFVGDSMAAWDCEDNINGSQVEAKAEMGNRAKAIYKMLRIRNELMASLGVSQIYINQIRHKVGASKFEDPDCLHHDTLIKFTDGRVLPIGDIVRDRIAGDVWSYNEKTCTIEPKPIIGWVKKEKLSQGEKWLSIITNGPGSRGGKFGIICTEQHGVLGLNDMWINAKNLKEGDVVLTYTNSKINASLQDFLEGSAIGDSSIRVRDVNTARYQLQDSENPSYLNWKLELLSDHYTFKKEYDVRGNPRFKTEYSTEWSIFGERFKYRDPSILFSQAPTPLTLAIWYMDDGHLMEGRQGSIAISPKRCNLKSLCKWLSNYGYFCNPYEKGIKFTTVGLYNLYSSIRAYVPESMQHKLTQEHQGYYVPFKLLCTEEILLIHTRVLSVKEAGVRNYRKLYKYDLTIEGNHNFFAGSTGPGFLVHNTTPGGGAMKFFAHQRIGMYAGKQIKKKVHGFEERVGSMVSIRVKKNKVAPPRSTIRTEVYFNAEYHKPLGLDRYLGLVEIFCKAGVLVKKSGGNFYYKGKRICKGEDNMIEMIQENDNLRRRLIRKSHINTVSTTRTQLEGINKNLYPVKVKKVEKQMEVEE